MIALEDFARGELITFRELQVYFEFRLVFTKHRVFFLFVFAYLFVRLFFYLDCEQSLRFCSKNGRKNAKRDERANVIC